MTLLFIQERFMLGMEDLHDPGSDFTDEARSRLPNSIDFTEPLVERRSVSIVLIESAPIAA